jgi:hypothetical protein
VELDLAGPLPLAGEAPDELSLRVEVQQVPIAAIADETVAVGAPRRTDHGRQHPALLRFGPPDPQHRCRVEPPPLGRERASQCRERDRQDPTVTGPRHGHSSRLQAASHHRPDQRL